MQLISSIDEVYTIISNGKKDAALFLTNLFPDPNKIRIWTERKELFVVEGGGLSFVLRKNDDFFHFYFCAPSSETLASGLRMLERKISVPLSADLIGKPSDVEKMTELFKKCGFQYRTRLQRFTKIIRPEENDMYMVDSNVSDATKKDAARIRQLLLDHFDQYAEQIPATVDIESAACRKEIKVIKKAETVMAFLFFERAGLTSIIRYWLVDRSFHGDGFGSKLMQTFLAESTGTRRLVLWVLQSNLNAIQKYVHYGFQPDELIDQIMVKGIIENG